MCPYLRYSARGSHSDGTHRRTAGRPAPHSAAGPAREFLWEIGGGFGSVALAGCWEDGFLGRQAVAADGVTPFVNPLAPKPPHCPAKAKSVIFLFMYGGPSHVDTFDYKPKLYTLDGKTIAGQDHRPRRQEERRPRRRPEVEVSSQYGQCGKWVSDLFPHLATCVDDIAFIQSMYCRLADPRLGHAA